MPQSFDTATKIRLAQGEVLVGTEAVSGSSQPRLVVQATIDAPPEMVWSHIENSASYQEFMPRVKSSQELSRNGNEIRTRVTIDMPFPLKNLSATTRVTHTVEPGVRFVRAWKLEEGDYVTNEGSWTLEPFDGNPRQTYALYQAHIIPKVMIPKAIQALVQEKAMPKMIDAIRARVRSSR